MALGPKVKWIKDKFKKINLIQLIFFIVSIGISYLIISKSNRSFLFSMPLFVLSFYLLFITIKDFFAKESILSQKISHFGFSLLILSILLNGIFSNEFSSNMKIGEEKKFEDKTIKFESLNVKENTNYKSLIAEFKIIDKKSTLVLNPEVRIYNKPKTITSEADISTTLYSDNFLVFNILKNDEYYNIRYQHKPLMIWIWLSTILISVGGILSYIKKKMIRNVKFLVTIIVGLIIFLVLLKGLEKPNNYFPNNTLKKIDTNLKLKMLYKNKEISLKKIIKKDKISLINVWASWCLPCRQEHSYLVSLKENNLNIIGINYKDQEVNAKKFLKKLGNPYSEVLVDLDGTKSIEMGAIGVPETYLVNSETAEIIKKFIGPLDSLKTKEIRKILKYEQN